MQLASALILSLPVVLATSAPAFQPCEPAWRSVGPGLPGESTLGELALFDDGAGPALYAGGSFTIANGGNPIRGIARWDGSAWSGVGGKGISGGAVVGLATMDDGSGLAIYMIGGFNSVSGVAARGAARWDGDAWTEVGEGLLNLHPMALAVFDDGEGPALYAGGWGNGESMVIRLVDDAWVPAGNLAGFADRFSCAFIPYVQDLTVFDDGSGPALYAGGHFYLGGDSGDIIHVARWDGHAWGPVGPWGPPGITCVSALGVFDDGRGPALLAAGNEAINRWDGHEWSTFPSPGGDINDLFSHDDGDGLALYVAGTFGKAGGHLVNSIARWDGADWTALGSGVTRQGQPGDVSALSADWNDPAALFAFGRFDHAGGGLATNLARWGCPPCSADCDRSGSLDLADFLCFSSKYLAGDPSADCEASGALDLFDFLCFTNAFNEGC